MTTDSHTMLLERVMTLRDRIESDDHYDLYDNALEIRYSATQDGHVREVTVTVAAGGPTLMIECLSPAVVGYWGSERVRRAVHSDDLEIYGQSLASRFEDRIDQ